MTDSPEKKQANAARARESEDPHENRMPIPGLMLVLVAMLVAWSAWYIATASIDQPASLGGSRTTADLRGNPNAEGSGVDGAEVFVSRCVACHQTTGQGLPGVFPPLAGSEWVNGEDVKVAKIVLRGVSGKLTVSGVVYNGSMPAFADQLGDAEIAAVLSYVRKQWGNNAPPITVEAVGRARAGTASMKGPFNGDAALSLPGG